MKIYPTNSSYPIVKYIINYFNSILHSINNKKSN